jgi:hypothetical protein
MRSWLRQRRGYRIGGVERGVAGKCRGRIADHAIRRAVGQHEAQVEILGEQRVGGRIHHGFDQRGLLLRLLGAAAQAFARACDLGGQLVQLADARWRGRRRRRHGAGTGLGCGIGGQRLDRAHHAAGEPDRDRDAQGDRADGTQQRLGERLVAQRDERTPRLGHRHRPVGRVGHRRRGDQQVAAIKPIAAEHARTADVLAFPARYLAADPARVVDRARDHAPVPIDQGHDAARRQGGLAQQGKLAIGMGMQADHAVYLPVDQHRRQHADKGLCDAWRGEQLADDGPAGIDHLLADRPRGQAGRQRRSARHSRVDQLRRCARIPQHHPAIQRCRKPTRDHVEIGKLIRVAGGLGQAGQRLDHRLLYADVAADAFGQRPGFAGQAGFDIAPERTCRVAEGQPDQQEGGQQADRDQDRDMHAQAEPARQRRRLGQRHAAMHGRFRLAENLRQWN